MSDPTEALVRVLAANNYGTLPNMARAILADPGALLAALAEAGVLAEERGLDAVAAGLHVGHDTRDKGWYFGCPRCNPMAHDSEVRPRHRYVTAWQEGDR